MSKQLAISAAFSTFAMAAFALFSTSGSEFAPREQIAGAPIGIEAPGYVAAEDLLRLLD